MIEPTSSQVSFGRPGFGNNIFFTNPERKAELLKRPRIFRINYQPLEDSYLEKLIQRNIIEKHNSSNLSHVIATEVRALVNSLSDENKKKLANVVKAFDLDKENLEKINGIIFSGGEMRVIAETGISMVLYALFNLLGIKPKVVSGCSAGAFLALAQATGSFNSSRFQQTAKTNFSSWFRAPEKLEEWVNKIAVRNYRIATSNKIQDGVFRIDHLAELGTDLQVLVGEIPKNIFHLPQTYLLPREFEERFGKNPGSFEISKLIRATANLPILFFPLADLFKTCGNCFIEDSKGQKHFFYDPGIFLKYLLPLNLQLEEIEKYKDSAKNESPDKPGFYFIVGNKKEDNGELPETMFGKPTKKLEFWLYSKLVNFSDWLDLHFLGLPKNKLKKVGGNRTYLEANCKITNPYTGKTVVLSTGAFDIPEKDRETLMLANIPTSDFKDLDFKSTIDQLYENLVDPNYVHSEGKAGLSPYNLFLSDINRALKIQEDPTRAITIAKTLIQETQRKAAAL